MLAQLKGPQSMFTPGPDFREVHGALRSWVLRYLARMAGEAEEPYTPRGCTAQAWSVAEVLRCWVNTA